MRGNIGEWSELYTFLKLISEGKLYAADENINRIESIYYDILEIIKQQKHGDIKYILNSDIIVLDGKDESELIKIPIIKFKEYADVLYAELISEKSSSGSFEIPALSKFAKEIKYENLKSKSTEKRDITLVVHDAITSSNPVLGFSIKSRLGSPSTLLNASLATNFTFILEGYIMNQDEIDKFNRIKRFKDKFNYLNKLGTGIKFISVENKNFANNLKMIDSSLPEILAIIIESYYRGLGRNMDELTQIVSDYNPLGIELEDTYLFYSFKIKEFLTNVALGMMPARAWNGMYDATGGYIIVKEDGDILCYHMYNRNEFREYLFNNTRLESPSTTRHEYGNILKDLENNFITKLNLQIRFIK